MLNKLEYKKLCQVCDLLIENSKSISRISIGYLHIIRPHHIDLKTGFYNGKKILDI